MKDKTYLDYVEDISESINDIEEFVEDMEYKDFINDKKTIKAVIRSIEIMGEAGNNIPKEIRNEYPDVPWKYMIGMRNKLIHEYSGVDLEIVWQTIQDDLPVLKKSLRKVKEDLK